MKLIEKHEAWMEKGRMDKDNLLSNLPDKYKESFKLFIPSTNWRDYESPFEAFLSGLIWYVENNSKKKWGLFEYTPLRQTIVLLICAMHDEL